MGFTTYNPKTGRDRAHFIVSIDLDPIPGAQHTIEDCQQWLERALGTFGPYDPKCFPVDMSPIPSGEPDPKAAK